MLAELVGRGTDEDVKARRWRRKVMGLADRVRERTQETARRKDERQGVRERRSQHALPSRLNLSGGEREGRVGEREGTKKLN